MAAGRSSRQSRPLFQFDRPYRARYGLLAGVDEAGRGPLAGPVVAAAVILPADLFLPGLNDSKLLSPARRQALFGAIQRSALAVGVGCVEPEVIDRLNILQATWLAMRLALANLIVAPAHVLVDGPRVPGDPAWQTPVVEGDRRSASIAAASVVAKVTRDCLMEHWDRRYPHYGFRQHKGYGTPAHLECLQRQGPCPIHRRSFHRVLPS